jgi:hypothetical protein
MMEHICGSITVISSTTMGVTVGDTDMEESILVIGTLEELSFSSMVVTLESF